MMFVWPHHLAHSTYLLFLIKTNIYDFFSVRFLQNKQTTSDVDNDEPNEIEWMACEVNANKRKMERTSERNAITHPNN